MSVLRVTGYICELGYGIPKAKKNARYNFKIYGIEDIIFTCKFYTPVKDPRFHHAQMYALIQHAFFNKDKVKVIYGKDTKEVWTTEGLKKCHYVSAVTVLKEFPKNESQKPTVSEEKKIVDKGD